MHTVLIIEDQPDVASMIQTMISRLGHHSLLATTISEAQKMWSDHKRSISLVLADHTLPDGSGVEFSSLLRAEIPTLPIVITSGMAYAGAPHTFLRLDKPFTVAEFKRLLASISPPTA